MASILVPLDFSDCAPKLFEEAVSFARAFQANLLVLHVAEPPRGLPLSAMIHPHHGVETASVESVLRADTEARVAPMLRDAAERGVQAEAIVAFGPIAPTILGTAVRYDVSMIVMGTHGRTGLLRAALGSIAEEVLRRADVPVVTIRTRHHAGCEASSCATCPIAKSDAERIINAEAEG